MTGLKRHTVQVVDYDPDWAVLFEAEAQAVRRAAGGLSLKIEHVGSTAVPGLTAKPVVDIAVAIQTRDVIPALARHLAAIGYIDRGDAGAADGGHLFVKDSELDVRIVHLHVVEETDIQWQNYIEFRDILRANNAIRKRYAELKTQLATRFPDDRKSYTDGKRDFIGEVLRVRNAVQPREADGDGGP
jgi:GrpB-like predicted nucleotidyltransferase (UPF0157 family)